MCGYEPSDESIYRECVREIDLILEACPIKRRDALMNAVEQKHPNIFKKGWIGEYSVFLRKAAYNRISKTLREHRKSQVQQSEMFA